MPSNVKNNQSSGTSNKKKNEKVQDQKSSHVGWWLFRDKGTVAEPWPTAKELWDDEDVQNEIKKVKEAFSQSKNGA